MDETLSTLLAALERMDSLAVSDRVAALDALTVELPRLTRLSALEWQMKLAEVEEDVAQLREQAVRAAGRYEQALRALETLKKLAVRTSGGLEEDGLTGDLLLAVTPASGRTSGNGRPSEVARAANTREAILLVMARRPHHRWTVQRVTEDLLRYGRAVERSNVQVTLRRLADDGKVTKDGRGAYFIVPSAIPALKGSTRYKWARVAEQAADAFLQAHPDEAEREALVEVALEAVETYKRNHDGHEPDEGEPVIRRLMKSRLYDFHRRIAKGDTRVQ
jgi:hypothetical protein